MAYLKFSTKLNFYQKSGRAAWSFHLIKNITHYPGSPKSPVPNTAHETILYVQWKPANFYDTTHTENCHHQTSASLNPLTAIHSCRLSQRTAKDQTSTDRLCSPCADRTQATMAKSVPILPVPCEQAAGTSAVFHQCIICQVEIFPLLPLFLPN